MHDVEVHPFGPSEIKIKAVLRRTLVDSDQLDALAEKPRESPFLSQAFCTLSTNE